MNGCYLCSGKRRQVELGGLQYWQCESCGLIMRVNPTISASTAEEQYTEDYYKDPVAYPRWDEPQMQRLLTSRLRAINTLQPSRGALLDIGCGLGHFMAMAKEHGWEVTGFEPSRYAAAEARNPSLSPVYSDLSPIEAELLRFDCISMWDVLEHDSDPLSLLRRARNLMQPGGVLAVSMPNAKGIDARIRGGRWRFFRPEFGHISHYSPQTLARLLDRAGFAVVISSTHDSLNVASRFQKMLTSRMANGIQKLLDGAASTMGLGRNMTVYAKRLGV